MICKKCHQDVPDGPYCNQCGAKQAADGRRPKSRGNGQGSVYKLQNGKYIACKVKFYVGEDGKTRRKYATKCFDKKKDAVAALPLLGQKNTPDAKALQRAKTTFKQLYDLWLPTHRAGPSTLQNYKSAMRYFAPIYNTPAKDVDIDDLQECIDECSCGKATNRNMRTTAGLI